MTSPTGKQLWVTFIAHGVAALEQHLNRLAQQGYRIHSVLVIPRLLLLFAPTFVILATWLVEPVAGEDEMERSRR